MAKEKRPMGRPTDYCEEMAKRICELVATTPYGLLRLTRMYEDIPAKTTINQWRYRYPEFATQYAQAKITQAELLAEECLEIADSDTQDARYDEDGNAICNSEFIARSRLRVDTRKWLASKLIPKVYGAHAEEQNKGAADSLVERLGEQLSKKK